MSEMEISGTPFMYDDLQDALLDAFSERVRVLRSGGRLGPEALARIRQYFRIKNIYHSNAIEGNVLTVGETRQVVEQGLTLTGTPLKDQAEARNLSHALDFLETLAANPGSAIREYEAREIHRLVLTGIDDENAGKYRAVPVEISGSAYKPPGLESVPHAMETFGAWLAQASTPGTDFGAMQGLLRAVAAHTWFVQIHPFIDGNGRVARLLMNLLLMRYGYPPAIIGKEDRARYYDALDASQTADLAPFIVLVCECLGESLEEWERAVAEQRAQEEWASSIAGRFTQRERKKAEDQYEVWRSAMELFKSYFQQTADSIDQLSAIGRVYFKEFGILEFEKYLALRQGESAKRTWFFRIDFRIGSTSARYLFFYGWPSHAMRSSCRDVSVHVSREERPFQYERLEDLTAPNVPNLVEVGYIPAEETFVARYRNDVINRDKIEKIGRAFIEEAVRMHF